MTNMSGVLLTAGRVQTAILSAIKDYQAKYWHVPHLNNHATNNASL
jgi:hypothetical protein